DAEGGERNLVVFDVRDVFHDAFAVRCPRIDAEGEVSSQCAHVTPFLSQSASVSIQRKAPLRAGAGLGLGDSSYSCIVSAPVADSRPHSLMRDSSIYFLHEHYNPAPQGGTINSHERSDQP